MPAGYERLRDALKRKGKSDEEAKSMAAAIWNKHHKDNPVTNKKHMSALFDDQRELAIQDNQILLGIGDIGDNIVDASEAILKKRMKELGMVDTLAGHTQTRRALTAPLMKYPRPFQFPRPFQPKLGEVGSGAGNVADYLTWLKNRPAREFLG
jgi:hypothetical protein